MSNVGNPLEIRPFPWKCGKCGQREVHPTEGEYTTELVHDGRSYTVTVPCLQTFRCRNCGESVLDTEANKQISQAFRWQVGLLTPEEIRQNRKALGLTQGELGERLGIAEATLSRWENGWQIQQRSLDKLMRLFFEHPVVRQSLSPLASIKGMPDTRHGSCAVPLSAPKLRCLTPDQDQLEQSRKWRPRLRVA